MRKKARRRLFHLTRHTLLALWLTISVFPIYWMVSTSFKPSHQWYTWPPIWFPPSPTMENFAEVWWGVEVGTGVRFPRAGLEGLHGLRNSIVIAGSATLLSVAIGLLLAYGISRYKILSEQRMFNLLMLRMIPPIVIAIPLVLWYSTLNLLDTWLGMIAIYTITTIPYSLWMTKSFIDEVPEEMEQAAQILGASRMRAFGLIVVPLIRSGIVATCMFILILTWSEYLLGLVMTAAESQTLPVQLTKFEGANEGRLYGLQSALSIGVTIPLLIVGFLIHKHLVRGFSFGMIRRR